MVRARFVEHFQTAFPDLAGAKVLVALSGGADSVALLHLLADPTLKLKLAAAHVHHGVRGREADDDAAFCEELCSRLAVPFHLLRIHPDTSLVDGREGTWRRLRYRALLDLKAGGDFNAVATAHHRDDVAEGVLVQMLRGGGPRALSGIGAKTSDGIIRPLLQWTRGEIREWLVADDAEWREDSSNRDLSHLRNLVRHELLPGLETSSPSLRNHLVHLAESLAGDEAYFAEALSTSARWIDPWDPDGGVDASEIRNLPSPLRTRWLHGQAGRVGIGRVSRQQMALFAQMIRSADPRAVTLGNRWTIRLARHRLWLEPPNFPQLEGRPIVLGESVELPLPGWMARVTDGPSSHSGVRWSFPVEPGGSLSIRQLQSGDRVEIDGTVVRVSRIFSRTIPRHLRQAWPLFCKDDRIHWIPGVWQGTAKACRDSHFLEVMRSEQPASNLQR